MFAGRKEIDCEECNLDKETLCWGHYKYWSESLSDEENYFGCLIDYIKKLKEEK